MAYEPKIEQVDVTLLHPNLRNARTHSRRQINQIAASIEGFGFTNPILIDENCLLIAGHGRLEAAKMLSLSRVPCIRIPHLTDPEKRALMLADNKIALNAGWDLDLLASELADLSQMELSFDLEVTGFDVPEIDLIIEGQGAPEPEAPEVAPEPDRTRSPLVQLGDLWRLGDHRVLCGDARNAEHCEALMEGKSADAGFTDPPYNVPIAGHVSGKGRVMVLSEETGLLA